MEICVPRLIGRGADSGGRFRAILLAEIREDWRSNRVVFEVGRMQWLGEFVGNEIEQPHAKVAKAATGQNKGAPHSSAHFASLA